MSFSIADSVALGVFALGLVGYLVNALIDRRAKAAALRTAAYLDYFRAQSTMAAIRDPHDPEFQQMDALSLDARTRILLYGSKQVVAALKRLMGESRSYKDPGSLEAYTELLAAMRRESLRESLSKEDVARILVFRQEDALPDHVHMESRRSMKS